MKDNFCFTQNLISELNNRNINTIYDNREKINNICQELLSDTNEDLNYLKSTNRLDVLSNIITIANIIYNNSSKSIPIIDDGIYDMLVAKLQRIDYDKFTSGASPNITFDDENNNKIEYKYPFIIMDENDKHTESEMLFPEILQYRKEMIRDMILKKPFIIGGGYINKRIREVSHNYPDLVGTLNKCKFVLDKEAIELGVFEDPNVTIFERDFISPLLINENILVNDIISIVMTLKYDGVSVEADVTNKIESARTRGDTDNDEAADITPILYGYRFPNAPNLDKPIGMKFEAIVKYNDLYRLNEEKGSSYINGRTAIIGLMGSSDAWKYRDYITLIPLQADASNIGLYFNDRIEEINFLNNYYTTSEYLRYSIITGNYSQILFQIYKYVQEAQFARSYIPFMYDGVVAEFLNNNLRELLGRKNSINQYAMAIKFNPLTKQTIFRGYTYTVGQDGSITPMIHYDPVEFIGSIHTKSTGSSYDRFKKLDLRIGDIINITYTNDVMPYVTKFESENNMPNHVRPILPEEEFPVICPSCGEKLLLSKSGLSKYCPNLECNDRKLQRMSNMMSKLGIKDFSDASISILNVSHLFELMELNDEQLNKLGPTNSVNLRSALNKLITNPLPDYKIIGSLGFTGIAIKTWKLIFSKYSLLNIINWYYCCDDMCELGNLKDRLSNIKGIGPITANTIIVEFPYFELDIDYIIRHKMYIETPIGDNITYQIRFTGFRDRLLESTLNLQPNIDCDGDSGVTKNTTVLLVPYEGYNQGSKCAKAIKYGIPIVGVKHFIDNANFFIPTLKELEINK